MARPISATALVALYLGFWGLFAAAAVGPDSRLAPVWWSLRPVKRTEPPALKTTRNPIDRFITAKLSESGLKPSPPAPRATLIRRAYFDVIGLPPSPEEIRAHTTDRSEQWYERMVDSLLASPHFGERWARHWFDVIRFGESQGFERNKLRPNAWKYRDWVVDAFNRDMPYDEFILLQIAGDVLAPDDPLAVIASGFLVMGPYDLTTYTDGSAMMRAAAREEELEGLVGTTSQAFLGLTIQCARCHDHKFDPISQKEYYQIAAAMGGTYHGDEKESLSEAGRANAAVKRAKLSERLEPLRARIESVDAPFRQSRAAEGKRSSRGLLALYEFGKSTSAEIADSTGSGGVLKLASADAMFAARTGGRFIVRSPLLLTSENPPKALIEACRVSNEVTIEALVAPANNTQTGPARIFSLSSGTGERNFTLAQAGNRYEVRLRTTATDPNGQPALFSAEGSAVTRPTHVAYTRDSSGTARIYLNGRESATLKVGGDFSNWNLDYRLTAANETSRDRPWLGELYLAAVYGRALTAAEVDANFKSNFGRFGADADETRARILLQLSPTARREYQRLLTESTQIESQIRLLTGGPAHLSVPKEPGELHVLARGDFRQKGEPVTPSGIAAVRGPSPDWGLVVNSPERERRKALAAWITDPKNPLPARVMINRIWSRYFGHGLVRTPSDFGRMGERPSHPNLLDWLAAELVNPSIQRDVLSPKALESQRWTPKRIHRMILLSSAYRQSSLRRSHALAKDAENRLIWRQNPRRLDAECVRDAVLSVSGELLCTVGGPGFRDWTVKSQGNNEIYTVYDAIGPEFNRRTLYRMVVRSGGSPLLESLDCPDPSVATPRRSTTTTPLQALTLLNNRFMERNAEKWAARLKREAPGSVRNQIGRAYLQAFGRSGSKDDVESGVRFAEKHGLNQFCIALLNSNEFLYVD